MAGRTRSDIDVEIGKRMRQARLRLNLTQAEVAEKIGVTFQQVQKYERGDTRLALSTLARLRGVLRIEAADLLPPLRDDGSAIPDPVAAMGQTIVGVHLASIFGRMPPAHQQNLLNIAKAMDGAAKAAA